MGAKLSKEVLGRQDGETTNGFSASWAYARERWVGVNDTDSALTLLGETADSPIND